MKIFTFIRRGIVPLVVLCCFVFTGGKQTRAQSPPIFQNGDVFVGIGNLSLVGHGQIKWYRKDGTFVATLDTGQASTETTGMAFDGSGNLYATVFEANNIVKFDHTGTLQGTFGSGYNADPESILFDAAGNAYVGQADGNHEVLKFSSTGAPLTTFSPGVGPRGTDWIDLAADQKTLYYTSEGTRIKRFDLSTNTQLADFNAVDLLGLKAFALRILANGQVLVADSDRVVLLDSSGNLSKTYLASSLEPSREFALLYGLALDPDGKSFWTADYNAGTVWKVDIVTGEIDVTISTGSNLEGGVVVFGEPQSVSLTFSPGVNSQTAFFGDPANPASHAMSLTVTSALTTFNVVLTAHYVPTEFSTGTTGPGIADGVCEASSGAPTDDNIDCRLAAGGFVYSTVGADQVVPHCSPYHNNMCVWYRVTTTAKATDECVSPCVPDYVGPVLEKMGWNTDVVLASPSPNPEYAPGWNHLNERLYDRHGEDPNNAFQFDITSYYSTSCSLSSGCAFPPPIPPLLAGDQSGGGSTRHFNDFVWAAPPNPPTAGAADHVEPLVPVPGISPFPYLSGLPMLVTFELEHEGTEMSDPTALTKPHAVNVGTLAPDGSVIPVQFPAGFPTTFTYSPFFRVYFIFLSPAPYKTDGTVYTMQIGSDLFAQPVTFKFVVKKFQSD